eukprot:scaffold1804_cov263-Pinguiococcus_pyrenoidosus.AAC.9
MRTLIIGADRSQTVGSIANGLSWRANLPNQAQSQRTRHADALPHPNPPEIWQLVFGSLINIRASRYPFRRTSPEECLGPISCSSAQKRRGAPPPARSSRAVPRARPFGAEEKDSGGARE